MPAISRILASIPVTDFDRAKAFYTGTLGLSPIMELPGMTILGTSHGGVMVYTSDVAAPSESTRAVLGVADLDAFVAELKDAGVAFEHYPELPMTTWDGDIATWQAPSDDIPSQRTAWFKDPEGHILNVAADF